MPNTYKVKKTDAGNALFEGQKVTPYYEDTKEMIINGARADADHHVKKDGQYFAEHFEISGGN
ncbi:hypothetical protein [Paenibacillus sedimenti]|uniref:Uncharacterized protein n=1 Tax=Paenibacillus sedimenti TaxID=2770274 RepID=A0A926QK00_9BACL|nr:hypothetical protein [Paenibacillus sedimenti]MBD0381238.1 hypothetical protein [Paenibacillus sedimenti]